MKQKIFTLLTLLLCATAHSWAETETFGAVQKDTQYSGTSFTMGKDHFAQAHEAGVFVKLRTNKYSGTWVISVKEGYAITGIKVEGYTNNTYSGAAIKMTSLTADGGTNLLTGDKTFPAAVSKGTQSTETVNVSGFEATQNITCAFDNSNVITDKNNSNYNNGKNNQVMAKLTLTYKLLKTASSFTLTSPAAVELYKGKTADIAYSENAGSVTFVSDKPAVATVSDAGVITAVAEGTATITVSDAGSSTVQDAEKTVTVTVKEHKNTTTTANAAANGNKGVIHNGHRASDDKSATLNGVATIYDVTGSNGIQKGSTQTFSANGENNLTGIKLSGKRRIAIKPADGITITNVTCYIRSNGDATTFSKYYDASGNTKDLATAININSSSSEDPTTIDLTEYYVNGFRFEAQTQAVFLITYNKAKSMTVNIKETGYATLYTDYAVTIPEGVNAYAGTVNDDKDKVVLSAVTTTIPKNTAVILQTDTPGNYTFIEADDVTAITDNALQGVTTETTVASLGGTIYTLGLGDDDVVGMRQYTGTSLRAYSAYIAATDFSAAPVLTFDFGNTTAISEIAKEQAKENRVAYTLQGQRVAQPNKGLYIVNGKKVIIK